MIDHRGFYQRQIAELNKHNVYVGALVPVNNTSIQFLSMLVNVHNNGKTIYPVHGKYLTIPTPNAQGQSAREIDGLFFYTIKSGRNAGKPALAKNVNGTLQIFFLLATQVIIPARDFLGSTMDRVGAEVQRIYEARVVGLLGGVGDWHSILDEIGAFVTAAVQESITNMQSPPNAPITVANKGGIDDPLMNTGAMLQSISWVVV